MKIAQWDKCSKMVKVEARIGRSTKLAGLL